MKRSPTYEAQPKELCFNSFPFKGKVGMGMGF